MTDCSDDTPPTSWNHAMQLLREHSGHPLWCMPTITATAYTTGTDDDTD